VEMESDVPSLLVGWLEKLVPKKSGNLNKLKRGNQWSRLKWAQKRRILKPLPISRVNSSM